MFILILLQNLSYTGVHIENTLLNVLICLWHLETASRRSCKKVLPIPKDFSKALYTFDIGQNDLQYGFLFTSIKEVREAVPSMVANFSIAIHVSSHLNMINTSFVYMSFLFEVGSNFSQPLKLPSSIILFLAIVRPRSQSFLGTQYGSSRVLTG